MRLSSIKSHSLGDEMKELKTGSKLDGLTATSATIKVYSLLEIDSGEVKEATGDASDIAGANGSSSVDSDGKVAFDFGQVEVLAGCALSPLDLITSRAGGYAGKNLASQATLLANESGIGFDNQPADDGVEVVSSDSEDVGIDVTVYGTEDGDANTIFTEVITLNGDTAVASEKTDWDVILGVELSEEAAGTVTIREASGDQAITTISTGDLESGVAEPTDSNCAGTIPRIVGDDATTKKVGIIGLDLDGEAQMGADDLTGNSEKDLHTDAYGKIEKVLVGDLESARDVTVKTATADTNSIGRVLGTAEAGEVVYAYVPLTV
jgi:hypothetical protein